MEVLDRVKSALIGYLPLDSRKIEVGTCLGDLITKNDSPEGAELFLQIEQEFERPLFTDDDFSVFFDSGFTIGKLVAMIEARLN